SSAPTKIVGTGASLSEKTNGQVSPAPTKIFGRTSSAPTSKHQTVGTGVSLSENQERGKYLQRFFKSTT
ncbi:MAG: hypothetical protein N3B10_15715, partial [Armatimonadetes bacterium]|nr:hypothetical protein [Armatimonadota bacterium]